MTKENRMVWMDIPVENLERASKFYSQLMDLEFTIEEFGDMKFSLCPHEDNQAAFCLVVHHGFKPCRESHQSPLVYLNVNGRMSAALATISNNGGKILSAKEQIGPYGFRAIILDSEGNRIALHSQKDS